MHVVHEKHSTGQPCDVENFHFVKNNRWHQLSQVLMEQNANLNERHNGRCSVSIKPRYHSLLDKHMAEFTSHQFYEPKPQEVSNPSMETDE
jgi:hypothetical protein